MMMARESKRDARCVSGTRAVVALLALLGARPARGGVDVVAVGANLGGSAVGGDPAPDGDGVFFGTGIPVINDAGQVAFYATFTTGSGGSAVIRGSAVPGSLRIVVRQRAPAPDANGNFSLFGEDDAPALNAAGQVAFPARFVDTFDARDAAAVVRGDVAPDRLTLLARAQQVIDGLQLVGLPNPPPVLNASGQVVFGFAPTPAIFLDSGGVGTVVARTGQMAPDASGTFSLVTSLPAALNDRGQIAFAPLVSGSMGLHVEFLRADGSTIIQVVRHQAPAPDGDGTFDLVGTLGILHPLALNEAGEVAFLASLAGVSGPGTEGIFRAADPSQLVTIVRRGGQAPDGNGRFLSFTLGALGTVPLNDAGQVAFHAALTATSGGSADNTGIFRGDGTALARVVRRGDPAPDRDGVFATFDQPAINAPGQVAFRATLEGTLHTEGIFLYDDVAGLVQVARVGDSLLGQSIAGVRFAPDTSRGRKHLGLNARGQVAFQFGLQDGRRGVAVWSPGSPTTTTSTSTSTTGPAASTTSTTLAPTSTTTTLARRGFPTPAPTTTSLPPCATVRCIVEAARQGASCRDETLPPTLVRTLDRASAQAELAVGRSGKKAARLYRSAGHLLTAARKIATRATRGRRPKLSTQCAADVVTATQQGGTLVGAPGGVQKVYLPAPPAR